MIKGKVKACKNAPVFLTPETVISNLPSEYLVIKHKKFNNFEYEKHYTII